MKFGCLTILLEKLRERRDNNLHSANNVRQLSTNKKLSQERYAAILKRLDEDSDAVWDQIALIKQLDAEYTARLKDAELEMYKAFVASRGIK